MAKDKFRIRIKRDGTIHFFSSRLGVERTRLLREMIEDCLGPVVEVRPDDDGMTPFVQYADREKQERLRKENRS